MGPVPWCTSAFSFIPKQLPPRTRGFAGTRPASINNARSSSAGLWNCPVYEGPRRLVCFQQEASAAESTTAPGRFLEEEEEGLRLSALSNLEAEGANGANARDLLAQQGTKSDPDLQLPQKSPA